MNLISKAKGKYSLRGMRKMGGLEQTNSCFINSCGSPADASAADRQSRRCVPGQSSRTRSRPAIIIGCLRTNPRSTARPVYDGVSTKAREHGLIVPRYKRNHLFHRGRSCDAMCFELSAVRCVKAGKAPTFASASLFQNGAANRDHSLSSEKTIPNTPPPASRVARFDQSVPPPSGTSLSGHDKGCCF